ncbi:Cullin family-domain-containing protein [Umbelopsis sp. PMI_123]|nr:Cullin family-domain-containing protein [Umbelopsis sp. PMI_123]
MSQRSDSSHSPANVKLGFVTPVTTPSNGNASNSKLLSGNLRTKVAPKKLIIRNFKVKPQLPPNYEDETWNRLKRAVHAIQNHEKVPESLETLYKSCENLCHHKMADRLYTRLREECENHVKVELQKLSSNTNTGIFFLETVSQTWADYCNQMIMIRSIFLYLDRTYVLQSSGIFSLWDMGLELFRSQLLVETSLRDKIVEGSIDMITTERSGDTINSSLLQSLIRMFIDLSIYHDVFEEPFLRRTQLFYRSEGERLVHSMDMADYLQHVDQRLKEEGIDRINAYVDSSTKPKLIKLVETELLERHVDTILEKGFQPLLQDNRKDILALMYRLLSRVHALDQLRTYFFESLKKTGGAIVNDESRDSTMVQSLLAYKQKIDIILAETFDHNTQFANSMREAFESFINSRQNKPAELIAKFVDSKLRSGNKTATDEELESLLDRVLILFRFIHGKDVFEAFYKRDLAKRLLLGKSASIDAERSMLSKMKTECGPAFTSKLEGMFKDIDISRDLMTTFKNHKSYEDIKDLQIYVNVLTQGFWPTYPPVEITLPPDMANSQEVFKDFYMSKHNGRRLMWQNNLGHCVVKATFPKGKKELLVSLFQTVVLLLFNDRKRDRLTYNEIRELTNIEDKELSRTLQSLACGNSRVLKKNPPGRDVNATDSFSYNEAFTASLYRLKINTIQLKETVEENTRTREGVFQDRQYQVDAAIVRIMKTRKTLSHNMLINELFEQLRFPVKATDIKKRIESLIDREYMERESEDSSSYRYLA